MAHNGVTAALNLGYTSAASSKKRTALMVCQVTKLAPQHECANSARYAITISYLGRPALTVHLCPVHILDTWHLAQSNSLVSYGNAGQVKSVAVKKV